jgi:hypothetical protein
MSMLGLDIVGRWGQKGGWATQFYGSIFTQLCQGRMDSLMQKYRRLACLEEGFENCNLKDSKVYRCL